MGLLMHINLKNLRFFSFHGLYPEEQILGNEYFVTVTTSFEYQNNNNLDLKDTVNYEGLYGIVKRHMNKPQTLLETVAYQIMENIKTTYPLLKEIKVGICKNNPPFGGDLAQAEVNVHWMDETSNTHEL